MWAYKTVRIHWLGHDGFVLEGSRTVIIDPFKARGKYKADVLCISHEHSDHLSEPDIRNFTTKETQVFAPKVCQKDLAPLGLSVTYIVPGSKVDAKGVKIETIPAYNTNKFREPGKFFHPKEDGRVGYIVTLDGVKFYHAGDTDAIPEMKSVDVDIAFLPVSGTYVMTSSEAAEATKLLRTKIAIPMHFESIVGTLEDAKNFESLVGTRVQTVILSRDQT